MTKWSNGARKRLTAIREAEGAAADMQAIAEKMATLPPGQLKKVLTQDIIDILGKYGVIV